MKEKIIKHFSINDVEVGDYLEEVNGGKRHLITSIDKSLNSHVSGHSLRSVGKTAFGGYRLVKQEWEVGDSLLIVNDINYHNFDLYTVVTIKEVRCSIEGRFGSYRCYVSIDTNGREALISKLEAVYIEKTKEETKEEQHIPSIHEVLHGVEALLKYKESRYGNASTKDRIKVFAGKCNFGETLDNKLNRVANGEKLLKNDVVDLAGYLILTLREKGWYDFKEFMD